MIGVLRTILIILLVYYGLRILYRIFAPVLMRYASKKVQQQFQEHYKKQRQQPHQHTPKEGEITIDKRPPRKPGNGEKVGEYIDFEELD